MILSHILAFVVVPVLIAILWQDVDEVEPCDEAILDKWHGEIV